MYISTKKKRIQKKTPPKQLCPVNRYQVGILILILYLYNNKVHTYMHTYASRMQHTQAECKEWKKPLRFLFLPPPPFSFFSSIEQRGKSTYMYNTTIPASPPRAAFDLLRSPLHPLTKQKEIKILNRTASVCVYLYPIPTHEGP